MASNNMQLLTYSCPALVQNSEVVKDEWKVTKHRDFPPPVGKMIDLAYCLSLLFGRPVVSIYRPYYTALLHTVC